MPPWPGSIKLTIAGNRISEFLVYTTTNTLRWHCTVNGPALIDERHHYFGLRDGDLKAL